MDAPDQSPSSADLAGEIGGLSVGLGILTMTLFPFALPGLLLAVLLALPAVPLLLVAGAGYLVFRLLVLVLGLPRAVWRRRLSRRGEGDFVTGESAQEGAPARTQTRTPTLESRRSGPAATRT